MVRGSESSPQAQLKAQDIALVPKALLKDIELRVETNGKISRGPSIAPVINTSERISIENVTSDGFGDRPSVINDDDVVTKDIWGWMSKNTAPSVSEGREEKR